MSTTFTTAAASTKATAAVTVRERRVSDCFGESANVELVDGLTAGSARFKACVVESPDFPEYISDDKPGLLEFEGPAADRRAEHVQ